MTKGRKSDEEISGGKDSVATGSAERRRGWGRADLLSAGAAVVGVLGGLTFGLVRPMYVHFYAELGLRPDDVGMGPTAMVTLVVSMAVRLLAAVAVIVCLVVAFGLLFRVALAKVDSLREGIRRLRGGAWCLFGDNKEFAYFVRFLLRAFLVVNALFWPASLWVNVVGSDGVPRPFAKIVLFGLLLVALALISTFAVRSARVRVSSMVAIALFAILLVANQASHLYQEASLLGEKAMNGEDLRGSHINNLMGVFNGSAQLVPIRAGVDPLGVCRGGQAAAPLGSTGSGEWVMLGKEGSRSTVVFVSRSDYMVVHGLDGFGCPQTPVTGGRAHRTGG